MKKIFLFILIFFLSLFTQLSRAEELYKITTANFDTSNSLIILNAQDEIMQPILNSIKLVELDNPRRAYFDIPSAILTIPKQDWNFNTPGIKKVKINQFSNNPNIVRVVLHYDEDFKPANLKFFRLKNNIFIKIKETSIEDQYFHKTYRDEHSSASDFYEYLTVEVPDENESMVEQIEQAFNSSNIQKLDEPNLIKKDLKLNTNYYLSNITPRKDGILLSGFGSITIEKPLILTNPSRIVFDIPNTVVNREIRNSELKINDTDSVKIGQFEVNKARIVITTENTDKYIPIYSTDNQSILITKSDTVDKNSLFNATSDVIAYNKEKNSSFTSSMILSFNHPIVHGIERTDSALTMYLYNVNRYNEDMFLETFKNTYFYNSKIEIMPDIGLKITIPTDINTLVNTYIGADGKTMKIQITLPKRIKQISKDGVKVIVLDPGHGGGDCGAIRENITEKEITLDISKRVQEILEKQGYTVYMTRNDDSTVSLQERVEFSENLKPDIFVSIHVNSSEKPAINGLETHYYRQESLSLAQTVHSSLISNIKANNRGLFKSKFYVINHTTAPAILVEIGFLSNTEERAELTGEKRKKVTAKAIAEGVINYFKDEK